MDSAAIRDSIAKVRIAQQKAEADRIARAERRIRDSIAQRIRDSVRIANAAKAAAETKAPVVSAPPSGPTGTATVRLASRTPNAAVYINDEIENLISSARDVTVPAGVKVKIEIRGRNCTPWDTTIVVQPGTRNPIGRRDPKC